MVQKSTALSQETCLTLTTNQSTETGNEHERRIFGLTSYHYISQGVFLMSMIQHYDKLGFSENHVNASRL